MRSTLRPNVKLILAAICVIAGVVILWRSFVRPSGSVANVVPPTPIEISEPSAALPTAMQPTVTVYSDSGALSPPTQLAPTAISVPTQPVPTLLVTPTNISGSPSTAIAPVVSATQGNQPTGVVATAILPTQAVNSPVVGTAAPISTAAVATITPLVTTIPTSVATIAATPTSLPTELPTATLAVVTVTATPSSTLSPTVATLTSTATSTTNALIVYRVEGAASKVVVSYLDATGNENTVEVTLPWRIQFTAALDADLAVDAFSTNNESVLLTCAIDINGTTLLTDQTENAINGVACERFIN